jgi:hypothetical protein
MILAGMSSSRSKHPAGERAFGIDGVASCGPKHGAVDDDGVDPVRVGDQTIGTGG